MFSSNSLTNKMKLKRVTILTINILLSIFMSTVNCTDTSFSKNKKSSLFFLENKTEFVKMFAIANMLHYFSKDTLKYIQHPLKDKLEAFFKGITCEFEDESEFIKESYEFFDYLKQLNHSYSPYNHSLVDLLTKIQETLARAIMPIDNIDFRKYKSHPFLCQSFPLKTFYSTKNDIQGFKLMLQNSLTRPTILHPKDSFSSYFDSFCSIRIDFPRYFYGYTDGYDDVHPGKIDLREDYVYTIYDDFNFYKFRLKAFINEINGRYYFFVQENGNWRAFLNNREIFSFNMDTTCPIIFVLEKISEVKKK